jgi:beta-lactam-binding protein with PASTA domain
MTGAGYLLAAVVLFPAPLLPNERSVPRLRDQTIEAARAELSAAGFVPSSGRTRRPGSRCRAATRWC